MQHSMKLQDKYFDMIVDGSKIYEIRLNDDKRRQISVGDRIEFQKMSDLAQTVRVQVADLLHFTSFEEMAKSLPLEKVGFASESLDEVVGIYHQFYAVQDEQTCGVLAIKVELEK